LTRRRLLQALAATSAAGAATIGVAAGARASGAVEGMSDVDPRGGRVLRIAGFDLRQGRELAGLRLEPDGEATGSYVASADFESANTLPLLPNRGYVVTVLLKCEFERPTEINMGLRTLDAGGKHVQWHLNGIPNQTNGWQRWAWPFTTDPRAAHGRFTANFYDREGSDWLLGKLAPGKQIRVADVAVIELPLAEVRLYGRGEGVVFRGGPGNLPMRVEEARRSSGQIVVQTTGAIYTFDLTKDTVAAEQRLEARREVALWSSSLPLEGLEVLSRTTRECVLANELLTFGIQCDSLMMVVPHAELVFTCTSRIGGRWNRLACGHLLAADGEGGMAVNPDLPPGSGRTARVDTGIDTQPGRVGYGQLDFSGLWDNQTFLSEARPGWQVRWLLSPGDRLGVSVFPPRPFPWKQSFHSLFTIAERTTPLEKYARWGEYADILILWDFTQRTWAMSYGRQHIPYSDEQLQAAIAAARKAGMKPVPYMSPYYYYSRDAAELVGQVRWFKDRGFEGVYFDAVPSQEWVVAYEEMRMTREVFPDGAIILHATGHPYDGGPPLGEPSLKIPAIETYADVTYTGELVVGRGEDWAYPRYVTSQHNLANCIGVMKFDRWEGLTPLQRDLMMLRHGGRGCLLPVDHEGATDEERLRQMRDTYFPIVRALETLWEEKGDEPDFFERHYRPKAIELTKAWLP
jgi:hypothetical protein